MAVRQRLLEAAWTQTSDTNQSAFQMHHFLKAGVRTLNRSRGIKRTRCPVFRVSERRGVDASSHKRINRAVSLPPRGDRTGPDTDCLRLPRAKAGSDGSHLNGPGGGGVKANILFSQVKVVAF
ncbi:hypothetical protein FQA47_003935 [Oryzias melastigma]|uniref:Uncharacterized protein n=1 Tax=Oryzias melastigma TaxID=30732 RepID=A0A834BZZ7_ORYME|nr:hypothetical protein FQA47_003935 [Oryzias melastigma]